MREQHLSLLACSRCAGALRVSAVQQRRGDRLMAATLGCAKCNASYAIVGGVPRFVPRENYASGFGLEWTRHARTQYDSQSGIPASEQRFFGQTRWPRDLRDQLVLEVGSGSGRFTEQAAATGATIVSLDYSYAVEANAASNGHRDNVLIVQADVFAMPFPTQSFDRIFCFGMLQHTPSPARAFAVLPSFLKPGGQLCVDIYKFTFWRTIVQTKYWVRPVTRRMNPERLYSWVRRWVDFMWPLAAWLRRFPKGYALNWRLLVADYSFLGLQGDVLKEWAYLDTFDMLAPRFDRPATLRTVLKWAEKSGLEDVSAEYTPHGVVLRARASPAAPPAE